MLDHNSSLAPLLNLSETEFVAEMLRRFRADGEPNDNEAIARMGLRLVRSGLMPLVTWLRND